MDIGSEIRRARSRAGLSQVELADAAATSQATLSAYERGRKMPAADTLTRILAAAGTRLQPAPMRRVITPTPAELSRRGRTLGRVLELAAELPTRHRRELGFPRLPVPAPHDAR